MHRKIYAADLQFELSKEYMEDPYDVFLQLKGVVTPACTGTPQTEVTLKKQIYKTQ